MRVGDFDVVTEDAIEADLEAGTTGAGDFVRLESCDPLLAAAIDAAKLVELGVIAFADDAALADRERRGLDERRFELLAQLGAEIECGFEFGDQPRLPRR